MLGYYVITLGTLFFLFIFFIVIVTILNNIIAQLLKIEYLFDKETICRIRNREDLTKELEKEANNRRRENLKRFFEKKNTLKETTEVLEEILEKKK